MVDWTNHSYPFARILFYFGLVFHVRCPGRLKNTFLGKNVGKA